MRFLPLLLLASCASTQGPDLPRDVADRTEPSNDPHWVQGSVGVSDLSNAGGRGPAAGGTLVGGEIDEAPFLGGALQWGLTRRGDFAIGVEAGGTLTLSDAYAVQLTRPGGTFSGDADLVAGSAFVGAFASLTLNENWRAYGGLGPLLQLVRFDVDYPDGAGSGRFGDNAAGLGYYVRAGVERRITDGILLGLGARWFESDLDFRDDYDGMDFRGGQLFLTVSRQF